MENWSGIIALFGAHSRTCSYGLCMGKFCKLLKTATVKLCLVLEAVLVLPSPKEMVVRSLSGMTFIPRVQG